MLLLLSELLLAELVVDLGLLLRSTLLDEWVDCGRGSGDVEGEGGGRLKALRLLSLLLGLLLLLRLLSLLLLLLLLLLSSEWVDSGRGRGPGVGVGEWVVGLLRERVVGLSCERVEGSTARELGSTGGDGVGRCGRGVQVEGASLLGRDDGPDGVLSGDGRVERLEVGERLRVLEELEHVGREVGGHLALPSDNVRRLGGWLGTRVRLVVASLFRREEKKNKERKVES